MSRLLLLRLTACLALPLTAIRAEPPVIALARAYVGPEAALATVKSVHYTGSLVMPDPADPRKQTYVTVEIMVQAPYQQRIVSRSDKGVEVTALDGYDAWHRVQEAKDPARGKLQIYSKDQIKRLRANTWENLGFYRGLEREGGRVLDQGLATVDGLTCRKIAYVHADNIVFYRYFEPATGRLVLTENESGVSIREQGEIRAGGLRFPKAITTTAKGSNGQLQTVTITFDRVTVNETFPPDTFALPALNGR